MKAGESGGNAGRETERTPVSVHTPVTDTKETGASQLDISTADKLLVNKQLWLNSSQENHLSTKKGALRETSYIIQDLWTSVMTEMQSKIIPLTLTQENGMHSREKGK